MEIICMFERISRPNHYKYVSLLLSSLLTLFGMGGGGVKTTPP